MSQRTLERNEFELKPGFTHNVLIHQCTDPTHQDDVHVNIRVTYQDGTQGQFEDNVTLKGGLADHATHIGGQAATQDKINVVIQWR